MTATILGCGVAGSWLAHALATVGYDDFVLFDGGEDSENTRRSGPLSPSEPKQRTAAYALAEHLRRLNPDVSVEVNGPFEPERDIQGVRGLVIGGMGEIEKCMDAAGLMAERGLPFVTLGLPAQHAERIRFGTSGAVLRDGHFGGPTVSSRIEIASAAYQAIQAFC